MEVGHVSIRHVAPGLRFIPGQHKTESHRILCAGFVEGVECAQVAVELRRIEGDGGGLVEAREELIVDLLAGLRQREEAAARRRAHQCDSIPFQDVVVDPIPDF